jgi:hypothetical protein
MKMSEFGIIVQNQSQRTVVRLRIYGGFQNNGNSHRESSGQQKNTNGKNQTQKPAELMGHRWGDELRKLPDVAHGEAFWEWVVCSGYSTRHNRVCLDKHEFGPILVTLSSLGY